MIRIRDLKHWVALCGQDDIVTAEGKMNLVREDVLHTWAAIMPKKGSSFVREGFSIAQTRDERTHQIVIRYRPDIEVSVYAWLYEERRLSAPRWYKVISVTDKEENGRFFVFDCRLMDRSDNVARPVPAEAFAPNGKPGFDL